VQRDDHVGEVVAHGGGGDARVPVGQLADDEGRGDGVDGVSTDGLGNGQVEKPEFPRFPEDVPGEPVGLLQGENVRQDLLPDEPAYRFRVVLLLFRQFEIHGSFRSQKKFPSPEGGGAGQRRCRTDQPGWNILSAEERGVMDRQVTSMVRKKSRSGLPGRSR
jgi:hypothetical protein